MAAQQQIEDLNTQVGLGVVVSKYFSVSSYIKVLEMKLTVEGLEKERDFYFGEIFVLLLDLELFCR